MPLLRPGARCPPNPRSVPPKKNPPFPPPFFPSPLSPPGIPVSPQFLRAQYPSFPGGSPLWVFSPSPVLNLSPAPFPPNSPFSPSSRPNVPGLPSPGKCSPAPRPDLPPRPPRSPPPVFPRPARAPPPFGTYPGTPGPSLPIRRLASLVFPPAPLPGPPPHLVRLPLFPRAKGPVVIVIKGAVFPAPSPFRPLPPPGGPGPRFPPPPPPGRPLRRMVPGGAPSALPWRKETPERALRGKGGAPKGSPRGRGPPPGPEKLVFKKKEKFKIPL